MIYRSGPLEPPPVSLAMPLHRAVEYDYPFREVLRGAAVICDDLVVVASRYPDGTLEACEELRGELPLTVIASDWWDEQRGCQCLADATNRAIEACTGYYVLNLQADEVLHEDDAPVLRDVCDGKTLWAELGRLNFHGAGGFDTYNANPERWPCSVVRLMRRDLYPVLRSYGDATHLGWMEDYDERRHPRRDLRSVVNLWHYAYCRTGKAFVDRQAGMAKLYGWRPDPRIEAARETEKVAWSDLAPVEEFEPIPGAHPRAIKEWIAARRERVAAGAWE